MSNLLTLNYWFNNRGGDLALVPRNILILLIIVFLIGYLVSFFKQKNTLIKMMRSFFLLNFFIGLFELFVTYEELVFLSSRFWFIIWFVEMMVFIYFIYLKNEKIKKSRDSRKGEDVYKKYLP